jgi:PAS domain S-box-containing protein
MGSTTVVYAFAIDSAISIVLGIALLLVWKSDRTQKFTHSAGLTQLCNVCLPLFGSAYVSANPTLHSIGITGLSLAAGLIYMFSVRAMFELVGKQPGQRASVVAFAGAALLFALTSMPNGVALGALFTGLTYVLLGLVSMRFVWHWGTAERFVALLVVLIGINALARAFLGADGAAIQFSVGTVLRTALAIAVIYIALKRTRQASEAVRSRFQALTEKSFQGIVVTRGRTLLYANPAALKMFGHVDLESAIKAGPWSVVTEGRKHSDFAETESLLQGTKAFFEVDREVVRVDGTPLHVKLSSWPIEWEGRTASKIVIVDRTEAFHAEEQLKQSQAALELQRAEFAEQSKNALLRSNADLEQRVLERTRELATANLAKSQFLANMSHEIRTPMNAIIGLLSLLQATDLGPVQMDYALKTSSAAKSLLSLLNDVLDFSKIEAGTLVLDVQPFEMERVLRDLSVVHSASDKSKPVEFLFDVDPQVPKMLVGDAMRLLQVLINLTGNAFKFTASGEVVTRVALLESTGSTAKMRFTVSDTGMGIPPDVVRHIFDPFAQVEASTTRRFGGTGLGLSICKRLLGLMGTDLQVESTVGKGSRFYFDLTLPIADASKSAELTRGTGSSAPLVVLVVDDNPVALDVLAGMARSVGWVVDTASSGAQAIAMVENRILSGAMPYDAMFVDCVMEVLDGWITVERIAQISPMGKLPITVMVGSSGREQLVCRTPQEQARLSAYLVKPVTTEMMTQAVMVAVKWRSPVPAEMRPKTEKPKRLLGMRLLLVEDNALNQLVAKELLSAEGATVDIAGNGQLGVDAVKASEVPYDVVLMDMQMPVMDGCSATRLIREIVGPKDLPIVAITANTMEADLQACLDAGMNDHVGKPFDIGDLVNVLLRYRVGGSTGLAWYDPQQANPHFS